MAKGKKQDKSIVVPDGSQGEHDLYVRRTFGSVENVVSQLKVSMPAAVLAHADFSTARLRPATQVSAGLTEQRGDVVCDFLIDGMPAHAVALLEHQSRPDPTMPYRSASYRVGLWEEYVRVHPHTSWLPPVYAFVFYTGADGRAWTAALDTMDMHGFDPALREASEPLAAAGRYQLVDIAGTDLKQLLTSPLNPQLIAMWVLTRRATVDDDVLDRLEMLFDHLVAIGTTAGAKEVFESILSYVYGNYNVAEERVEPIMVRVGTPAKEASMTTAERLRAQGRAEVRAEVMTTAERLRAEGRAEGEARGEAKGRLEGERITLLDQMRFKFGAVPADAVARVNAAGSDQLSVWTRRVLTADSVAGVFEQ